MIYKKISSESFCASNVIFDLQKS